MNEETWCVWDEREGQVRHNLSYDRPSRTYAIVAACVSGFIGGYMASEWIDSNKTICPNTTHLAVRRIEEKPSQKEVLRRAHRFLLNIAELHDGDMARVAKEIVTQIDEVL